MESRPIDASPEGDAPASGSDGGEWVVVDDGDEPILDYYAPSRPEPTDRPMDALRVRQLSALRRGAYRTRSYCLIGLGACAVAALQLLTMAVRHVRHAGWGLRPVGYICGVVAAMMAAAFLFRHVRALTSELRRSALAEPETPPDFSTLSDGSQYWQRLKDMTGT